MSQQQLQSFAILVGQNGLTSTSIQSHVLSPVLSLVRVQDFVFILLLLILRHWLFFREIDNRARHNTIEYFLTIIP